MRNERGKVYLRKNFQYGLIKTTTGIRNNNLLSIPLLFNLIRANMKITLSQLKRIIKEEVVNDKRALATRKNRTLKEYVTSAGDVNEQLEAAVVAYLESRMAKGMELDEAHEFLINEVEGSFEMFSVSLENNSL